MGGENPSGKLDQRASKVAVLRDKFVDEHDKTVKLLRQHKLKQAAAKLKEIDKLVEQLTALKVTIPQGLKDNIESFRDVVEGRKTVEDFFGVTVENALVPPQYEDDWTLHEQKISTFVSEKVHGKKYQTPKEIEQIAAEIEIFTKDLSEKAVDKSFPSWVQNGLYSELYRVVKEEIGSKPLSEEMQIAVGYVFDQALRMRGGSNNEVAEDQEEAEEIKFDDDDVIEVAKDGGSDGDEEGVFVDPLLVYSGRLEGKFKLPDADSGESLSKSDGSIITGEDFLDNIENKAMPEEIRNDLNEALEELGSRAKTATPWQEALLSMFAVYVMKPAYEYISIQADVEVIKSLAKKVLLYARGTIAKIFETPEASAEMVEKTITFIRLATADLSSIGLEISLGSSFDLASEMVMQMINEMQQNVEFDYINTVMARDPQSVAEARLDGGYPIVRLQSLTYLLLQLKEENKDNKALVIGVQFAIQIVIRLYNDDELLRLSSSIRRTLQGITSRYGVVLAVMPFSKGVGSEEADAILRMILPDSQNLSQKERDEKTQSLKYKKIEKLLAIVEDSLTKDPEQYSKYNAVLICLIENIKTYLLDENAEEQLLKDWATLRKIIKTIVREEGIEDPLLQIAMESPGLIEETIAAFYKESPEVSLGKDQKQLNRLKTVLSELSKEYQSTPALIKGLELASMVLDGFENDQDFFKHMEQFEKILDEILFGNKYGGLKLSEDSRQALRKIIGYIPVSREEPDEKTVQQLSASIGPLTALEDLPPEEQQKKALDITMKHPEIMKLNYAIGGLQPRISELIKEKTGDSIGPKELALIEYAITNYRDYLCDKYDNSTTNFLLDIKIGLPPKVDIKTENVVYEARILGEIISSIANKIGATDIAALVEEQLKGLAIVAQTSARKDLEKA